MPSGILPPDRVRKFLGKQSRIHGGVGACTVCQEGPVSLESIVFPSPPRTPIQDICILGTEKLWQRMRRPAAASRTAGGASIQTPAASSIAPRCTDSTTYLALCAQ